VARAGASAYPNGNTPGGIGMRRARRAVVFVAAAFIASAGAVAPAAAGKFGDVVGATTAPGSQISKAGHFFLLDAGPGSTVTQSFRVNNPNGHPVTVAVEAVDAITGEQTGVELGKPGSAKALISRWVVVSTPEVTLAPATYRDIPFTVHVPVNATPGQYLAGVSASVPLSAADAAAAKAPSGQAGFSMAIRFQRSIAVEIDVPGARAPRLQVSSVEPEATPGAVNLGVHMANVGNAFAHGSGVIRVADTNTDVSFKIDTFVAGTSIVYPVQWTKTVVPGTHHVEVDLTYEDGRRTSWTGTVVIAGDAQSRLENALRNVTIHQHASRSGLLLGLVGAVALVLVAAAIVLRRRGRGGRPVNYQAF
jgi:hypothetical protein